MRTESVEVFLCMVMLVTISRSPPKAIPKIAIGFRIDAKVTFDIL